MNRSHSVITVFPCVRDLTLVCHLRLASNCSVISCRENEKCIQINDISKCVCKDDYEGPDCKLGKTSSKIDGTTCIFF